MIKTPKPLRGEIIDIICVDDNFEMNSNYKVEQGREYKALNSSTSFYSVIFNSIMIPYPKKYFKTVAEIREEKINIILEDDDYCHYSDLPSPMAYINKEK
jgi:hypothetical protein